MKNENKKRVVRGTAVALCVSALGFGAMSYFTDYTSRDLHAKAGTLTMDIPNATSDLTNGLTIINPGDSNPLDFTVRNTGEKSMDVKAVITVTAPIAFNEKDHEFKVTTPAGAELGVTELSTTAPEISTDKKTLTYTIKDVALAGSIEKDMKTDGATENTKAYNYKFVMDEDAKNAWQGKQADVKIEVYAKQHRNTQGKYTPNSTWHKVGGIMEGHSAQ